MQQATLLADPTDDGEDNVFCECLEVAGGTAVACSKRCPGKSTPNEDSSTVITLSERLAVLVVADGVGGCRAGEAASRLVVDTLRRALREVARSGAALRAAVLDGIETANRAVLDMGCGAASTLALVEIEGQTIRPYHVGDSMILNVGQRGKIKLQTISHSPVGFAIEAGLLDAHEAMHHEQRHVVSNVVGSTGMRIEVGSALKLDPRDTLVVASDGLSDNLHVDEIVEGIRKGPLVEAVEKLARAARNRMIRPGPRIPSKPDDLTIIVFRPTLASRSSRQRPRKK